MDIEDDMSSCLNDMEQIQAKMHQIRRQRLQKLQRLQKAKAEENKKMKDIEPNMKVLLEWVRKKNQYHEQTLLIKRHDALMMRRGEEYNEVEKLIIQNHYKYFQPDGITKVPLFHNNVHKRPDIPSEFMAEFIEATYNLFQIQQQQIDELKTVVAELSAIAP